MEIMTMKVFHFLWKDVRTESPFLLKRFVNNKWHQLLFQGDRQAFQASDIDKVRDWALCVTLMQQ